LSVLRRSSPSRLAASPLGPARQDVRERPALELAELAGLPNEVSELIAGDHLFEGILAVGHGGRLAFGLLVSHGLVERLVLGPPRRSDRARELARDAQLGECMEARAAAATVEANGLHEADARLLDDVVGVAARQVEA
jgi:hypothetical protein